MTLDNYTLKGADRESLISNHIDLVKRIVYKIHGRVGNYAEIEDLMQVGVIGLIEASNNYVHTKDGSFPNYASMRVKGAIIDHLRRASHLSRQTISRNKKLQAVQEKLRQQLGREPKPEEIAAKLKISSKELLRWESQISHANLQSIEEIYHESSAFFASDWGAQDAVLDDKIRARILAEKLGELDKNQALVLQLYFVEELNTYEIAKVLDLSPGRISQIKSQAFKALREKLGENF